MRALSGLVICATVLTLLSAASLAIGARPVSFSAVLGVIGHFDVVDAVSSHSVAAGLPHTDTDKAGQIVVVALRLPRTVIGVLVGAALGLAGCLMQGVTRNPLADPGILGVNSGAGLCVVLAITVAHVQSAAGYIWFAFAGAAAASVLVYCVAALGREGATPIKLALVGAALSATFGAITQAFLLLNQSTFDQFRFWQVGSLAGRGLSVASHVAPFLLTGCLAALLLGRRLNMLALGDDLAHGAGVRVGWTRLTAAAVIVVLSGGATAAAGPIGFLGLVVPHAARLITGPDYRWTLPYSMLLAPILLLGADIAGRILARPGEIQVAILTAMIGAPVFIAIVRRRNLVGL